MALSVKEWTLREIKHLLEDGALDLAPDYQRREAWSEKKKMTLIDSVARGIPINAITAYKTSVDGALVYEIIDGKQRLSAVRDFQSNKLVPKRESMRDVIEEEELEGEELASKILDRKWSELTVATRSRFLEYALPVYIVDGPRASAVRAFRRMNSDPYALTPQEIRNAVFRDSAFLVATRRVAEKIDELKSDTGDHLLVEWGVIPATKWNRMQDLQFLSELLLLYLEGPQEARRTLDTKYEDFSRVAGARAKKLKSAEEETVRAVKAALTIMGNSLKPHLDGENNAYALIGAIFRRGIPTGPQLANANAVEDLRSLLSTFGDAVTNCQQTFKDNDEEGGKTFPKEVKEYAASLLGGQVNSEKRRKIRIDILAGLINDRIAPVDPKKPSAFQRKLVWARSPDKICGRCREKVDFKDFDCGHIDPKAHGGRATLSNLRVEHKACNRSAKAKR